VHLPTLWDEETTFKQISDITPQLASWDKHTHPAQIRLKAYLQEMVDELLPLPSDDSPLFLHLDVDVQQPAHLLKHHDLENYLTPLFGVNKLDPARFALVSARKYVGGGSHLRLGIARPFNDDRLIQGWDHFAYTAQGSVQTKGWMENLRNALAAANPVPLASTAVAVQIAWVCSPQRNWVTLWKPTGDCMGPVLGESNSLRPFSPNDDRIVDLKFHLEQDPKIGHAVYIGMWWRAADFG
jgi:hypothetical protein